MLRKVLKWLIPSHFYELLRRKIKVSSSVRKINNIRKKYGFCIIFISTPEHGNLGDQAIVYAQMKYFDNLGLGNYLVEVPASHYIDYADEISKVIKTEDIIVVDGGGNMGTLWIDVEYKMRDIVLRFPENSIFIFPQTIYYEKNSFGTNELEKSKEIYNNHEKLYICAREENSYKFMISNYDSAKIILVPDIVLFLNGYLNNKTFNRNGAILCLRKDKEKILDDSIYINIINYLKKINLEIKEESTVISGAVNSKNRLSKLNRKWEAFAKSKIVITDRLHGMVFAFITNTPCLALDNSSGKVGNVYKWIENSPYVEYVSPQESIDRVNLSIDKLLSLPATNHNCFNMEEKYSKLSNAILTKVNRQAIKKLKLN